MTYKVVLTPKDKGYSVGFPELPGCLSQGETRDKAILNIRVAIQQHLSVQPSDACQG